MKKRYLLSLFTVAIAALLTACQPDISGMDYQTSQAGQASRTVRGVIIVATPVKVSGSGSMSGIGTLAGAAAGAVGGSAIGGGTRANLLGGIGGALIGGAIGNYAENKMTTQTGMQYQVQLSDGSIVTVTQGATPTFTVGQHVFVAYGDQTRVLPDTTGQ